MPTHLQMNILQKTLCHTHSTVQKFRVSKMFALLLNTFIQHSCTKLIKSDSKYMHNVISVSVFAHSMYRMHLSVHVGKCFHSWHQNIHTIQFQ